MMVKKVSKKSFILLKLLNSFPLLLFCICIHRVAFAQISKTQNENARIAALVQKVQEKSRRNRTAYLSEYERTYKLTIERENSNKINSWVFEQYCLNDGKPYCRIIETEKDGKARSSSKIQKEREKASKDLIRNEGFNEDNKLFGNGTGINSLWVEPTLYLKNCRIFSATEKLIEGRTTISLRVDDCKLLNDYSKWTSSLQFMTKTEAEILIDEKDESVMRMDVYAKREFPSTSGQGKPIIIMENTRMPEGYWLFKKIRLETIGNKLMFPELKDNWQFDFYGYRRVRVDVEADRD